MSSEPMRFPGAGRRLLGVFLLLFTAPILFGFPAALWYTWRLDPVQNFYLGTYALSAFEGETRGAVIRVRYGRKTASGRAPEELHPGDAVRGTGASQPLVLSARARANGLDGPRLHSTQKAPATRSGSPSANDDLRQRERMAGLSGASVAGAGRLHCFVLASSTVPHRIEARSEA